MSGLALLASLVAHLVRDQIPLDVGFVAGRQYSEQSFLSRWSFVFGAANYAAVPDHAHGLDHVAFDAVVLKAGSEDSATAVSDHFGKLRPGGLFIIEGPMGNFSQRFVDLVDFLNRGCFDDDFPGPLPGVDDKVKLAIFVDGLVVLAKHGVSDEMDYLTLGDYGRAYGEGRGQVLTRLQLWNAGLPPRKEEAMYFGDQMQLYGMRISSVSATLVFRLSFAPATANEEKDPVVVLKSRDGAAERSMSVSAFKAALANDMVFALAIHKQRVQIGDIVDVGKGHARVELRFLPAAIVSDDDVDVAFHPSLVWHNWTSYFRDTGPHPLHVTAQTFREKSLMVREDLSDFYKGAVSISALEDQWSVTLHSPDCSGHQADLRIHGFACIDVSADEGSAGYFDASVEHSRLYHLFAKEKLDCCIGRGAFGDLIERNMDKHQEELKVSNMDGRLFANNKVILKYSSAQVPADWVPSQKVNAKVKKSLDGFMRKTEKELAVVDDNDCSMMAWQLLWPRLRPGGLYGFEQDGCYGGYHLGQSVAGGHVAPASSVTGWARERALALASGADNGDVQLVAAHKNLVVVQRAGASERDTWQSEL